MLYPSMKTLLKKVDSRYTLVLLAAKRARQLTDGVEKLVEYDSNKPVSIAVKEIEENKIGYVRTRDGIK